MPAPRTKCPPALARFAAGTSGAVTVDWTVLAALVTAVTIAMHDEVSTALNLYSDDVSEELTNSEIVRAGQENQVGFSFDGGETGRWSGAVATDIPGFGYALGPIEGSDGLATLTHDFIMASNVDTSIIRFDLYSLDTLDSEDGVIYINNREVGRVTTRFGNPVFTSTSVEGITIAANVVARNEHLGGYGELGDDEEENGKWEDAITVITIAVDNPGDVLSFGFGSTADEGASNESYAIDNFNISGVQTDPPTGTGGES